MRSEFVQNILNQVDIEKLINQETTLKHGQGLCPFHDDHNPSLHYYPDTDSFYCFGCGAGGTAIDWIIHRDNVSAAEAIKTLCREFNIPYQKFTEQQHKEYKRKKQELSLIREIHTKATEYYHSKVSRDYWYERGFTDETIDRFKLGYADGSLFSHLSKDYSKSELLKSNLFFKNGTDFFQRRHIIPYTYQESTVYFIGRRDTDNEDEIAQLPSWNQAKYLKLPLWNKKHPYRSKLIENTYFFGVDTVRDSTEGIITEGAIDCIHALQAGFSSFSPVTEEFRKEDYKRMEELCRQWDTTYIVNDNEESGIGLEGANSTAEYLFKKEHDVRVVILPRPQHKVKVDLADYLKKYPKEDFQSILDNTPEFLDYRIKEAKEQEGKEFDDEVIQIAKLIANLNPISQDRYKAVISSELGITKTAISKIIKQEKGKEDDTKNKEARDGTQEHDTIENLDYSLPLWQVIEAAHWRTDYETGEQYRVSVIKPEWKLAEIVEKWFDENDTKWFSDSLNTPFMFHKKLYEIGDNPRFRAFFQEIARVNNTTQEGRYLFESLQNIAVSKGKKTSSSSWLHLDRNTHTIYVNLSKESEKLLKISPHKIEAVPNATNEKSILLYSSDKMKPIEFLPDIDPKDGIKLFSEKLLDNLACNPFDRLLVGSWTMAVFLKGYTRSRALMKFSGGHQAGKTVGAKLLASLIYGTPTVKVSTVAANFTDAAKNPLSFIDDLETENLSDSYLQFLRLAATGATKEKRDTSTTSENVLEKVDALVLMTAIDPLAQQTLISRSYDINFNRRYQTGDFLEDDAIYEIINHRNLILSSIFKVLAHQVLPRFASGDQREIVKMLRLEYPDHAKQRTNAFLASVYMIYEGLNHYCPLSDASPKEVLEKWISIQQKEASAAAAETTPILLYLNSLWDYFAKSNELFLEIEGDQIVDGVPTILKQYGHLITPQLSESEEFSAFTASANGLHNAFAKYCRQHGLKYKFSNPRQVMKHISDAEELLSAHGWEIEKNIKADKRGSRYHRFRRYDDVVPF